MRAHFLGWLRGACVVVTLAVTATGCRGTIGGGAAGSADGGAGGARAAGGAGGATSVPSTPADPVEVANACTVDAPWPRRALRLSNRELLATLRALFPLDDAAVPPDFLAGAISTKPDDGLSVSRSFHENVDALVTALADRVAAGGQELGALGCPVADFGTNAGCTNAYLTAAAAKLFRGAAGAREVADLQALVGEVAGRSGGKEALRLAVRAMALNPRALYLLEGLDGANAASTSPMTPAELGSFLSYRITGGPPRDSDLAALRQTFANGAPSVDQLRGLVVSRFAPAELQHAAAAFFDAWLNVDDIATLTRDPSKHPGADEAWMRSLQRETRDALASRLTPTATLEQIMTTEAPVASAGDDAGSDYAKFGRPGVFTLPGVIASASTVDHTDIPRRGRFLLRNVFCEAVPTPPANLTQMLPPLPEGASERQRFEKVEMEPSCRGCHVRVNRLGFALESYDEMGRVRAVDEKGNAIVTSGTHTVSGAGDLTFADARDLFRQAAKHPVAETCLALQAFRFYARRLERGDGGSEDACLIRDLVAGGRQTGFRLVDLFVDAIVRTALAKRGK